MNYLIQNAVAEAIKKQSFFQKNANTIVAGIGAVAAILSFVATLGLPIKDEYAGIIPAVVAFLTAFAIKLTPNGVQPSTADKLENTLAAQVRSGIDNAGLAVHNIASSIPAADSELPVYSLPSSADVENTVNEALGQAHGVADSLHDQGVALGQDVQEFIGRHRAL